MRVAACPLSHTSARRGALLSTRAPFTFTLGCALSSLHRKPVLDGHSFLYRELSKMIDWLTSPTRPISL